MTRGALANVRVIEYGQLITAPYCAKLLGDMGAEVIKVEDPAVGDKSRRLGPFPEDQPGPDRGGLFQYLNTSKLGVTLNPKTETGAEILRQLIATADVFVENTPPGTLETLSLDYPALSRINPGLVMTSISPFGQSGPYRHYQAQDLNLWHAAGMGYITREQKGSGSQGPPMKAGGNQAEFVAGLSAATASLCALHSRRRSGRGQHIDLSAQECLAAMPQAPLAFPQLEGRVVGQEPEATYASGIMRCRDGQVLVGMVEEGQWARFLELMGMPEWAKARWWMDRQARVDNWGFLSTKVAEWLSQQNKADVLAEAQRRHVPIASLDSPADILSNEQFRHRGFFVTIDGPADHPVEIPSASYQMSRTPWAMQRPAPKLGEHNQEILGGRLGYGKTDLISMYQAGII